MVVIFDWDGTLIDSADKIAACMRQAARDLGLPVPPASAVHDIIGLGLEEGIRELFGELDARLVTAMRERYSRHFVEADQQPCQLFPGVADTLERLRSDGYRLAVATGKSRRGLDRVLRSMAMADLFLASRCADETRSKPDPLMLHELCRELDTPAEAAWMVGDTEYDMEMASRLGMPRIGVSYGSHGPERLRRWQPLAVIDAFDALPPLLRQR